MGMTQPPDFRQDMRAFERQIRAGQQMGKSEAFWRATRAQIAKLPDGQRVAVAGMDGSSSGVIDRSHSTGWAGGLVPHPALRAGHAMGKSGMTRAYLDALTDPFAAQNIHAMCTRERVQGVWKMPKQPSWLVKKLRAWLQIVDPTPTPEMTMTEYELQQATQQRAHIAWCFALIELSKVSEANDTWVMKEIQRTLKGWWVTTHTPVHEQLQERERAVALRMAKRDAKAAQARVAHLASLKGRDNG